MDRTKIKVNNPFTEKILGSLFTPTHRRITGTVGGQTVTIEDDVLKIKGGFSKLYRNKELLLHLSPEACRILVWISLHIEWDAQSIRMRQQDVGLSRRQYPRAVMELVLAQVIQKEKREWYWVNLTILFYGKLETKEEKG